MCSHNVCLSGKSNSAMSENRKPKKLSQLNGLAAYSSIVVAFLLSRPWLKSSDLKMRYARQRPPDKLGCRELGEWNSLLRLLAEPGFKGTLFLLSGCNCVVIIKKQHWFFQNGFARTRAFSRLRLHFLSLRGASIKTRPGIEHTPGDIFTSYSESGIHLEPWLTSSEL